MRWGEWVWSGESGNGVECLGVTGSGVECLGVAGSGVYSEWVSTTVCGRCQQCVGVVRGECVWFYELECY